MWLDYLFSLITLYLVVAALAILGVVHPVSAQDPKTPVRVDLPGQPVAVGAWWDGKGSRTPG